MSKKTVVQTKEMRASKRESGNNHRPNLMFWKIFRERVNARTKTRTLKFAVKVEEILNCEIISQFEFWNTMTQS